MDGHAVQGASKPGSSVTAHFFDEVQEQVGVLFPCDFGDVVFLLFEEDCNEPTCQ